MYLTQTPGAGTVETDRLMPWDALPVRAAAFLIREFGKNGLCFESSVFCSSNEPLILVVRVRGYGTFTGSVRDLLRVADELREY